MCTQINCQKHFYFKLYSLFKQFYSAMSTDFVYTVKYQNIYILIQFSVSTVSMSTPVSFQTIQFSIGTQFCSTQFNGKKNISLSSYSVLSNSSNSNNSV